MKLTVTERTLTGKKVKRLRDVGQVPAVIYGKDLANPTTIAFEKNDFLKIYRNVGLSLPIELEGGSNQMVIVKDYLLHPVRDTLMHVDFLAVNKDEAVEMSVPLQFVGESSVEKLGQGQLQYVTDHVIISAKPGDIPRELTVDVSVIATTADVFTVGQVTLPANVALVDDAKAPVITVSSLMEEEDEVSADTTEGEE